MKGSNEADVGHLHSAADALARARRFRSCGGRSGTEPGINVAIYHRDPAGQIVEFFVELDHMTNEELGWVDPRPWHEDYPRRPKRCDAPSGGNHWGSGPAPEGFMDHLTGTPIPESYQLARALVDGSPVPIFVGRGRLCF